MLTLVCGFQNKQIKLLEFFFVLCSLVIGSALSMCPLALLICCGSEMALVAELFLWSYERPGRSRGTPEKVPPVHVSPLGPAFNVPTPVTAS